MKHLSKLLVLFGAMALAACDSNDSPAPSSPPPPAALAKLQVLHASPDAPAVNVLIDGATALPNVDYKTASSILTLNEGTYSIQVDGIWPSGCKFRRRHDYNYFRRRARRDTA